MHITVDGKPIDDLDRSSSDVQRCTDVVLDNANIQFHMDNLRVAAAARRCGGSSRCGCEGTRSASFIYRSCISACTATMRPSSSRAEIRIFEQQSLQAEPLAVIPVDDTGLAEWQPVEKILGGPARQLKYRASRL